MARTKTEPVMPLPTLPSDTIDVSTPPTPADVMTETPAQTEAPPVIDRLKSLVDRLKSEADEERLQAEQEFLDIVQRLARDAHADVEDDVLAVLQFSGKSVADLEAAVARQKKINRLNALIDDLPAAVEAQREMQKAFNDLKAAQKKQTEQMEAELKAARGRLNTAIRRVNVSQDAKRDLQFIDGIVERPAPPQWNEFAGPQPCIVEQLKVENLVNEQIKKELGPNAITGPSVPSIPLRSGVGTFAKPRTTFFAQPSDA